MHRGPVKNKQTGHVPTRRLWSGVSMKVTGKLHVQGVKEDSKCCSEHRLGVGLKETCSVPWMHTASKLY